MFKAAMIQLRSGVDVSENVENASALMRNAAGSGAKLICTPEMTSLLDKRPGEVQKKAQAEKKDFALKAFRDLAAELSVVLHVGSLPILKSNGLLANRSYCIAENGKIISSYDKIHMFDVDLPDGQVIRESEKYEPGDRAVICETSCGKIGMTVCYDVRFPALFADLALEGAEIMPVPSAFTVPTGQAHWHVLLRARAIENGCYIIAAAQGGEHQDGRITYGHSLAVDPWGEVIAEGGTKPEVLLFDIDCKKVTEARMRIPNLQNRRAYKRPKIYK